MFSTFRPSLAGTLLLIAAAPAAHAFPTKDGGTGLFLMRTAETTLDGRTELYASAQLATYDRSPSTDLDALAVAGLNYGFRPNVELGMMMPILYNTTSGAIGVQDLRGHITHRFFGGNREGLAAAYTLHAGQPMTRNTALSSGQTAYGLELNLSLLDGWSGSHITAGLERSDTKVVGSTISQTYETKLKAGAGFAFQASNQTLLTFEFAFDHGIDSNDENLYFVPALRYQTEFGFEYGVAVSLGIPPDRTSPQTAYFLGLSYGGNESRRREVEGNNSVERAVGELQQQNERLLKQIGQQNARLEQQMEKLVNMEQRLTYVQPLNAASDALVEVVVDSSIAETGKLLAERLGGKGFRVTGLREHAEPAEQKTWVYYRPGYAEEAIKVGKVIPHYQIVKRTKDLPPNVDVRVVVGRDQVD